MVTMLIWMCQLSNAFAFNGMTHEQIVRSAFRYLALDPAIHVSTATDKWISTSPMLVDMLARATVDADYRPSVYLKAIFHKPFVGGMKDGQLAFFSQFSHFVNMRAKGYAWDHDGYAYRHTDGSGNDSYLDNPLAKVAGELSEDLGGRNREHPLRGVPLGTFNLGFKGDSKAWRKMYFDGAGASSAVFPPANVSAQLAYNAMLRSNRAIETKSDSWDELLPMVTGIFSDGTYKRHYWRGEIGDLPQGLEHVGLMMHLAQDVSVPQHAQGIAAYCHQEFEDLVDALACGSGKGTAPAHFYRGDFEGFDNGSCQKLYDPELVRAITATWPALNANSSMSISDRLLGIAGVSARWEWGDPDDSIDFIGTTLPDGTKFSGDHCAEILKEKQVIAQAKYQYNLAVAATALMFELSARDYETVHRARLATFDLISIPAASHVFLAH